MADGDFAAGKHTLCWDGNDDDGRAAASGVYFVSLETGAKARDTSKVVLLR